MGMDIHLSILNTNGEYICKEIFNGRCSEWFNNLMRCGSDEDYQSLPVDYNLPENAPEDIVKDFYSKDYFGFNHFTVGEFKKWFDKVRPDLDAGWVTTYDKWVFETKSRIPYSYYHELPIDANIHDFHFIAFDKEYDKSRWLYSYLLDNAINDDYIIIYYFDN